MTFTCHGCGCKADRDIPRPDRDDINIIYFCHACAWGDEGDRIVVLDKVDD